MHLGTEWREGIKWAEKNQNEGTDAAAIADICWWTPLYDKFYSAALFSLCYRQGRAVLSALWIPLNIFGIIQNTEGQE